jgi:geranylgeranyl reductase family protein
MEADVVISGAGPAGCSSAISLNNSGLKVILIDKSGFPRDKVCGDALSLDVVNQLSMLSPALAENFRSLENKTASGGVIISSPAGTAVELPFFHNGVPAQGYVSPRKDFDNFLFQYIRDEGKTISLDNCALKEFRRKNGFWELETEAGMIRCRFLLAADGANSVIARKLFPGNTLKSHQSAGLRCYYEGVEGLHPQGFIELHFFEPLNPGYFWIFPLPGGLSNVGLGVPSRFLGKRKINLKQQFADIIREHPIIRERFRFARPLEEPKGYGLPLGSSKRRLSGDGILLLGDAAGLIDPLSGEGIGNAIRSGRVAADQVMRCFSSSRFDAAFTRAYDREIYRRMNGEFSLSRTLQGLASNSFLFNALWSKASKNETMRMFLADAMADNRVKRRLLNPLFYLKLLR